MTEATLPEIQRPDPGTPPRLHDERSPLGFRRLFGDLLARSQALDTALRRIRLGSVDLSARELAGVKRFRVLVAEVDARTVEEEAYGLDMDPEKRESLARIRTLLETGVMEIRSAPLGGWSPDFSVFSGTRGPHSLLLGLHWFQRPSLHRGPAWAVCLGETEARHGHRRYQELWEGAHDIGEAILGLLHRASRREAREPSA
jgi:hypothetical protein